MTAITANVNIYKHNFETGETAPFEDIVAVEHGLKLNVDKLIQTDFICTPQDLEPLVLGWLYTYGLISCRTDVNEMVFSKNKTSAEVTLSDYIQGRRKPSHMVAGDIDMSGVKTLIEAFSDRDELFLETGATHSCLITIGGEVRYRTRDIGRHNAIDKAVGLALADGVDFSGCILLTSGRVPSEIAEKVIMAGIPVMIARSAPTQQAVDLAKRFGLKLLGFASQKQCNIYT